MRPDRGLQGGHARAGLLGANGSGQRASRAERRVRILHHVAVRRPATHVQEAGRPVGVSASGAGTRTEGLCWAAATDAAPRGDSTHEGPPPADASPAPSPSTSTQHVGVGASSSPAGVAPEDVGDLASSASTYKWQPGCAKTWEAEVLRRQRIAKRNAGKSAWNAGVAWPDETRSKIRATILETYSARPELIEDMRSRSRGRTHSEETKQKIRRAVAVRAEERKAATKARREVRAAVNAVWLAALRIPERREAKAAALDAARRRVRDAKAAARATKRLQSKQKAQAARGSNGGDAGGRTKRRMGEAQRRKIAESVKRRWADASFREHVQAGIKRKQREGGPRRSRRKALPPRKAGDEGASAGKEPGVGEAPVATPARDEGLWRQQQALKARANELLALAHEAARELREAGAECGDLDASGAAATNHEAVEGAGLDPAAHVEIQRALESLDDANHRVRRLSLRTKLLRQQQSRKN